MVGAEQVAGPANDGVERLLLLELLHDLERRVVERRELAVAARELQLGALSLRDVLVEDDRARHVAVRVAQGRGGDADVVLRAVARLAHDLEPAEGAAVEDGPQQVLELEAPLRRRERKRRPTTSSSVQP